MQFGNCAATVILFENVQLNVFREASPTQLVKTPEQEHVWPSSGIAGAAHPFPLGAEGILLMSESVPQEVHSEKLGETRLLTEVNHLLAHRLADGSYDPDVEQDIRQNLSTAVQEGAMPYAVTETFHEAGEALDEAGRLQRTFFWLGRSALMVATSGYQFHSSEAAFDRVGVEVAEAGHSSRRTRGGVALAFLSPKMSRWDASADVAKQEHLYADDSIRVSFAVTDDEGSVVGRRLQSLLVRDVPLDAWVDMLKDDSNIFGKSFDIRDERSALSVMELFEQLELPEDKLPEGPVTLVAAVAPYIQDEVARSSVIAQLERYRGDQDVFRNEAEEKAEAWLQFEKELAESLYQGQATLEIQRMIASLQFEWGDEDLALIRNHDLEDGGYIMTRQLAARLEKAKRYLLNGAAAIATGNEKVLAQIDDQTRVHLEDRIQLIGILRASGAAEEEIRRQQAQLDRDIASQNFTVGGGCLGENDADFQNRDPNSPLSASGSGQAESGDRSSWKWKKGLCRIVACSSRPGETLVGPCEVCFGCQRVFDTGGDPTRSTKTISLLKSLDMILASRPKSPEKKRDKAEDESASKMAAGRLLLAGVA